MGDSAGGSGSTTPSVAAAVNAAFGRFGPGVTACYAIFGGDTYSPYATTSSMLNYDTYLTKANISASRAVMTPGNHDNGPGGASEPSVAAWLAYNTSKGTLTRTNGGWINQIEGIPNTDQFIDIGGFRFFFINSGAVLGGNATPGWPVPHTGGTVAGNARVTWLRSNWSAGLKNIVVTHHPRWSYYGNHHDNATMQNLYDEILGKNDGTSPHACLVLSGHDHNMQIFQPQSAAGQFPGLIQVVAGLGSTSPYTAAGPSGQTSQKSWLQFANFTSGAAGFLQLDLFDDGSVVGTIIDAVNTSGNPMTNTGSSGITGSASFSFATTATGGTITYQYRVDGGSWVDNSTALTKTLTGLAPGSHVMEVRRVSGGSSFSDVSSYAWVIPQPVSDAPIVETAFDNLMNTIPNGAITAAQQITFKVSRTKDIKSVVPETSLWMYTKSFTGCVLGCTPHPTDPMVAQQFVANARKFWVRTTADGNAQFNPNGQDETNAQVYPTGDDATAFVNGTVIPQMNGTYSGIDHPIDFILTFMGRRKGETAGVAELTWPSTGWTAFQNWVYGDNSYVEQCINRWAVIMQSLPRRAVWRLWHEYRNSETYTTNFSTAANYVAMFQKVAIYLRQIGALRTGPGSASQQLLAWNPADGASTDGVGNPVETWFPGTYPSTPGGVDVIANDSYITSGTTPPYISFTNFQSWYDKFKPGSALNPDNVPIMIVENGIYTTDPNRILHLTEWFGDGTNPGLLQTTMPGIKCVVYWNGATNDLLDTPAGFQDTFKVSTSVPYFIPSNIPPEAPKLMGRLDGTDLGQITSQYTTVVNPGVHKMEFWTETNGVRSAITTFNWTVNPIVTGKGSGTYVKQIVLNKNLSAQEIWVRAVGADNVATVARRKFTLDLTNPKPASIVTRHGAAQDAGGATTKALVLDATAIPAGNSLIAVWCNNDDGSVTGVTDTDGHTWTIDENYTDTNFNMGIAHLGLPSGQVASRTVTFTYGTTATRRMVAVYEVAGIITSGALDRSSHLDGGIGANINSGLTAASTQQGILAIGLGAYSATIDNSLWTPGANFGQLDTFTIGATNIKSLALEWLWDRNGPGVQYQTGIVADASLGSHSWMGIIATFKSVLGNFYTPAVGFGFPEDGAQVQTSTVPIEIFTDEGVVAVNVTLDNTTFFPLTAGSLINGQLPWTGTIQIPTTGEPVTIFAIAQDADG